MLHVAGLSCVGGKRRIISESHLFGGVAGGSSLRCGFQCQGGDPSDAGVDIVPHEDPCVWVLPGGRPVGTPGLAGAIGAQL